MRGARDGRPRHAAALIAAALSVLVAAGGSGHAQASAAAPVAGGTIVCEHPTLDGDEYAADADGSDLHRLGPGVGPLVAPSGKLVTAQLVPGMDGNHRTRFQLVLYHTTGALDPVPVPDSSKMEPLAWSPDSRDLAVFVTTGGTLTTGFTGQLEVIDVASGRVTARVDATDPASASFAPSGPERLVYVSGGASRDLYELAVDGSATQVTHSGTADSPVWTRRGIVYVDGSDRQQLVRLGQGPLQLSPDPRQNGTFLGPVAASADGTELLTDLSTPDGSHDVPEAYLVDLATGAVTRPTAANVTGQGISRDGSEILATDRAGSTIVLPSAGGTPRIIKRDCGPPSWSG